MQNRDEIFAARAGPRHTRSFAARIAVRRKSNKRCPLNARRAGIAIGAVFTQYFRTHSHYVALNRMWHIAASAAWRSARTAQAMIAAAMENARIFGDALKVEV